MMPRFQIRWKFTRTLLFCPKSNTIENTAKTLKKIPSGNDIRYHLNKINDFEDLERQINQALKSRVPRGIKDGHLKLAIDLNLIPN